MIRLNSIYKIKFTKFFMFSILIITLIVSANAQSEQLEFGITKFSSISSPGEVDTYSFTANNGDRVNIIMVRTSGLLRPKITIYSPNGDVVNSAYDTSKSEISLILPTSGIYTILAENGYTGSAYTGDYSIFCQRVNDPGNFANLQFGVTKFDSIEFAGEIDTYSFTANSGDSINSKMVRTSGLIRPKITLYSPTGEMIKSAYDTSKSEISFILPATGSYTIIAENGYTGSAYTGDYSIFFQRVNKPGGVDPLQFGVSKSESIEFAGEIDTYSFTANSGEIVNIKMVQTSGLIRPKITLYSPNGDEVESDYDTSKSEISVELQSSGTYTIIAENGYTGSAYTGDYSIFLQRTSSGISEPISEENSQENTQNTNASLSQLSSNFPFMDYILPFIITVVLIMAVFVGGKYKNKSKKENKEESKIYNKENLEVIPSIGLSTGLKDKTKEPVSKITKNDVFISYSSEDKPIADATCANLESKGIRCWIAPRDVLPGKNYQGEIIDAIDNSHIMVLIFSSNSNTSPYIIRELTEAVENGAIIIPFRIENVVPSKDMKFLISVPHWLDAMTPPLEQHIEKLAETIQLFLNGKIENGIK